MSVSTSSVPANIEKATHIKKNGGRSDASLPPRIPEKQSIFPYFSMPTREFSRMFADHITEWIMRRRENGVTADDIIHHHQLIREANRRNLAGEKLYQHKAKRPKPAVTPPEKDEELGPFLARDTRLSLPARKRMNDVRWVKPGRTKHVKGAPPLDPSR